MVEILSPSTAHRDRGIKLDLYARRGVREYPAGHERFTGEIPVRLGNERVGLINLDEVFSRHLDLWAAPDPQP